MKRSNFKERFLTQMKQHKKSFILYLVLRVLVIITMILQLINGNYENVFFCFLTLILFIIPSVIEMKLSVKLPDTLEIIILLFIFSAEILGEIQNFYNIFTHWDTILHTLNGFLCAAIGFSMIDILNRTDKFHINLTPLFVAIVGFCFSMTIGVMWEFFEYGSDYLMKSDMQKDRLVTSVSSVYLNPDGLNTPIKIKDIDKTVIISNETEYTIDGGYLDIGITDTMKDLTVNFIGAVIFCSIGYFYVKKRGEGGFAKNFLLEFVSK
ncbi:MAG: hypothetical protein RSD29_02425 [Bacilli bacterium]